MKERLIILETAKIAKDKGFNWKVRNYFQSDGNSFWTSVETNLNNVDLIVSRPTQSLLQKWLREEHEIYVNVKAFNSNESIMFFCDYYDFKNLTIKVVKYQKTYEEALEIGLQEALILI